MKYLWILIILGAGSAFGQNAYGPDYLNLHCTSPDPNANTVFNIPPRPGLVPNTAANGNIILYCDQATGTLKASSSGAAYATVGAVADPRTSWRVLDGNFFGNIPNGPGLAVSTPTFSHVGTTIQGANCSGAANGQTVTITINAGDTVFVNVSSEGNSIPFFVWDDGGNIYRHLLDGEQTVAGGGPELWATSPGVANAAAHVYVEAAGAATGCVVNAVTYTGVKAFGKVTANAQTGTAVTATLTTQDVNNTVLMCGTWAGGANTFTATSGTARFNTAGTASFDGLACVDNTTASPGSVTAGGTITSAANGALAVELRSVGGNSGLWNLAGPDCQAFLNGNPINGSAKPVLSLQTSTLNNGGYCMAYTPANFAAITTFSSGQPFDIIIPFQLAGANTSNVDMFVGLSNLYGPGEFAQDYIGCAYATSKSDTTVEYVNRAALSTAQRSASSLSAIDNLWHQCRIRSTPSVQGSVSVSVDNGAETTLTTNLPEGPLAISATVLNRSAASHTLNIQPPYGIESITNPAYLSPSWMLPNNSYIPNDSGCFEARNVTVNAAGQLAIVAKLESPSLTCGPGSNSTQTPVATKTSSYGVTFTGQQFVVPVSGQHTIITGRLKGIGCGGSTALWVSAASPWTYFLYIPTPPFGSLSGGSGFGYSEVDVMQGTCSINSDVTPIHYGVGTAGSVATFTNNNTIAVSDYSQNYHTYSADVLCGTSVTFKLDGSTVATLATNTPNCGTAMLLAVGVSGLGAGGNGNTPTANNLGTVLVDNINITSNGVTIFNQGCGTAGGTVVAGCQPWSGIATSPAVQVQ